MYIMLCLEKVLNNVKNFGTSKVFIFSAKLMMAFIINSSKASSMYFVYSNIFRNTCMYPNDHPM